MGKTTTKGHYQSIPQINKWSRLVSLVVFSLSISLIGLIIPVSPAIAIEPPFSLPSSSDLLRIKSAIITTSKGRLAFELYPEDAPWHVSNFKYLADSGFYRGKTFHILISDFIIQGGRNNNPDMHYVLPAEFSQRKHEFGILGMARTADYMNPLRNSSSTQFHILLQDAKNMDGSYTIFGKLIDGAEVLESLRMNDRINDLTVFMRNESAEQEQAAAPSPQFSRQDSWYEKKDFIDQWTVPNSPNAHVASYDSSLTTYGSLP